MKLSTIITRRLKFFVLALALSVQPFGILGFGWRDAISAAKNVVGYEHCGSKWIKTDTEGLKRELKEKLYGQHLVHDVVLSALDGHWNNPSPQKPLVLSFHGTTGVGKNYVSYMIAENLFLKGMYSKFAKVFVAEVDFPDSALVTQYKAALQETVKKMVKKCGRSLFVFDEVEKMPAGILDSIKPFLDHFQHVDGVDYRRSTFIFLSNTGGIEIANATLTHWQSGRIREELQFRDIESVLSVAVYNVGGGLAYSSIIQHGLVSAFIPFLPLERRHVKMCIKDIVRNKRVALTDAQEMEVTDELTYYPPDLKLFSRYGCKRVEAKIDFVLRNRRSDL